MSSTSRPSGARPPRVSVVMPSYNHAAFLDAAIGSVLGQSLAELELVIVDDGSRDASREHILRFDDARIVTHFQENQGAHAALNKGLELAAPGAEYIAILNSDDEHAPTWLERCVQALDGDPSLGFCSGRLEFLGDDQRYKRDWYGPALDYYRRVGDVTRALSYRNFIMTTSNVVIRRSVLERVGGFRPLRYVHDLDMFLRLAAVSGFRLLDEALVRYRVHEGNTIAEGRASNRLDYEFAWILVDRMWREYSASQAPEELFGRLLDLTREVEHPEVARAALALFPLRAALDSQHAGEQEIERFALELLDEQSPILRCMTASEPGLLDVRVEAMKMRIGKLEHDLRAQREGYERRLNELQESGRYRLGRAFDEARDLRGIVQLPAKVLDIARGGRPRPAGEPPAEPGES